MARQAQKAPRDLRTVRGMMGSEAYLDSMRMKIPTKTKETTRGIIRMFVEAKLIRSSTSDET